MDLTDKQHTLWRQQGNSLSATPDICQQALTFYAQYRNHQPYNPQKAPLKMRVAYFLSQKAQILYDNQGKRIKGVAISANSILRDYPNLQQFLYHLKQMLRVVNIPPQAHHLQQQVAIFSRSLSTSLAFLVKMTNTLKKIHIRNKSKQSQQEQTIQRLLWLMFVDCKKDRPKIDLIQTTCLLSSIFSFYVAEKYQQPGVWSIYFSDENEGTTLDNQRQEIQYFMQHFFKIKDLTTYQNILNMFDHYLNILGNYIDTNQIFSAQNASKNMLILQKKYCKRLDECHIDQSTFLRASTQANYGQRMTPFARRPILGPRNMAQLSHKILSYDWNNQQENQSGLENVPQPKMKGLPRLKTSATPTMLIRATPVSQTMQMYNWLHQKSTKVADVKINRKEIEEMLQILTQQDGGRKCSEQTIDLVGGLWRQGLQNCQKDISKALLLVSGHLTLHIISAPQQDFQSLAISTNLPMFELWQTLDFYLNFDKNVPLPIRLHLHSLQSIFVKKLLWRDQKMIQILAASLESRQQRLAKRVIHQCALQIQFLCKKIQLQQEIQDFAFIIMQEALKEQEQLLFKRALDQMLVCSVYAACKVKGLAVKMSVIIVNYCDVMGLSSKNYDELSQRVRVGEEEVGIIKFYNNLFMPTLKPLFLQLRQVQGADLPQTVRVRQHLAQGATCLSSPQMANYYAYNESPILKKNFRSAINNTTKRQKVYTLQDIQAKFGKAGGGTLRQTRKIKH